MPRIGTVIREVYHRPGCAALPAHLEDHYGMSAKVYQGCYPSGEFVSALAAALRAHCGRPA
jgi:hypothetical protein